MLLGTRPRVVEEWLESRRAAGLDRFDEVWGGEYHVAPAAHGRHGDLDQQLAELLGPAARAVGLRCLGPVNIGTVDDYRVPDRCVVDPDLTLRVFLPSAVIVIEIVSPDDETLAKFDFYFQRGVVELLVVDPDDRSVRWFRRGDGGFVHTPRSELLPALADLAGLLHWPD